MMLDDSRQAGAEVEIEVTPEMIEAGRSIAASYLYQEWEAFSNSRQSELLSMVFRRMSKFRPSQ